MSHRRWAGRSIRYLAIWGLPGLFIYLYTQPWPDTPDGLFHLHRARALAEALTWGVLYPRWFPDFAFGYGYPVLNFYAPASYYPPALLALLGLDLITATRVALALIYALSGWATYRLLRAWTGSWAAAVGAALYLFYPYHLYDLFVRGALPEFVALLWLPLLLWMTWRLVEQALRREGRPGAALRSPLRTHPVRFALTALVWSGLILTHNLTALMAALALLLYILVLLLLYILRRSRRRWPPLFLLLGPLLLAGLMSAFYVVPALLELPNVGLGSGPESQGYLRHFVHLRDLFTWAIVYPYPNAAHPTVPVPAYALLILLGGVGVLAARRSARPRVLTWGLVATLLTLYLTTWASAPLWRLLLPLLGKLQFPWRWQAPFSLALAVVLGLSLDALSPPRPIRFFLASVLILFLGGYAVLGLHPTPAPYRGSDLTPEQMWAFDREHGQVGASWTGEFLPRWVTEQRWAIGREPADPNPTPTAVAPQFEPGTWGYLSLRGRVNAEQSSTLTFHTFYYPAWRVLLDGRPLRTRPATNLGLLSVDVPPGEHTLTLRWGDTPATRWGDGLSLVGWGLLLLGLFLWGKGRRARALATAVTLLVLTPLVVRVFLPDGILRPIRPAQARYPVVTLTGGERVPTLAHQTLRVRLLWLARDAGTPLTAFVHLVGEDGRVVAQHDGPIGATVTPPQRWFPGLLIPDDHPVPLDNVPPGTYHVRVGVYRPGEAAHPLQMDGQPGTTVDLGTVDIGARTR